jgi:hypothetical protein
MDGRKMTKEKQISEGRKPAEWISFAQLFKAVPMDMVKEALCATGANDKRERDLPAKYMVYFVMAMGMYSYCSSTEVFRNLVETLKTACGPLTEIEIPAKSSLTYARQKLGAKSFEYLFRKVVQPIARRGETIGAFFKHWRLVTIDANTFLLPDTAENEEGFGRAQPNGVAAPYPAIRCVGLVEIGTRVLFDYELGGSGGDKNMSETVLAERLLPRLKNDQLCIADRLYPTVRLWSVATATGAALLWRIKANVSLPCERVLEDGSYMSCLYGKDPSQKVQSVEVRVIEYEINGQEYRLVTNVPVSQATNEELSVLYHERWEHETTNNEQKSRLNAYLDTLRSKTPELAEQELIGLFLMHYAVRVTMHDAAVSVGEDVDRLSFKHTLAVIRRRAPQVGAFPPPEQVYESILLEVLEQRVHRQIGRAAPRAVKTTTRKYPTLTKHRRKAGMFGYRKGQAAAVIDVVKRGAVVYG